MKQCTSPNVDFETIVCDPDLLGEYLYVATWVTDMLSEMCDVDRERIPEIVETLHEHLDIPSNSQNGKVRLS